MELNNIYSLFGVGALLHWPNSGPKRRAMQTDICASVGGKALGKSSWMWDHLEAAVSTLLETRQCPSPVSFISGCWSRSSAIWSRSRLPTQLSNGHMQRGCCCHSKATSHKHGLLVSSRQNFCIIKLVSSFPLSDTHWAFANAFFISLYTPPTSFWLNLLAHTKPALQHGEI